MTTPTMVAKARESDAWNLSELYGSDEAWKEAVRTFERRLAEVDRHRGRLGESSASLTAALDLLAELRRELRALASYAHMKLDLDTRDAASLGRAQEIDVVGTRLDAAASFVAPEILAVGKQTIDGFLAEEPALAPHAHDLDNLLRRGPHTLSPSEEKLLADAGVMAGTADNVYGVLANADLPWPEIALSGGEKVRLDPSGFVRHRAAGHRDDRRAVFGAFFSAWQAYARTFGVALDAEVRKNIFFARARRYGSAIEASLDRNRIPMAVYDAMLETARQELPSLHRYLALRARMLNIADLGYHDIYAPLVPASARDYTIEEAKSLILEALAPLGDGYVGALASGYEKRWIDLWPRTGKRSGAYSNGSVYDRHPFILMNYNGSFDSVTTLAHESGHAMHSFLANDAQPFPTADYPIFVAEVASTFSEALLYRHVIARSGSEEEKLFLLTSWLDGMRGTFYRQALFAEFERAIYRVAEEGNGLTADNLGEIYLGLLRTFHGSDSGVCAVDPLYRVEWAYIPHFYANFYVYQYATGFAASTALARRIAAGAPGAVDAYLRFLRAGGSDYPFELLRSTGVDLTSPEPYRETVAEMNRVMDQIEELLARRS